MEHEGTSAPHILIVDDEPFNIEILTEHLEQKGYSVEPAYDGVEAWELLQRDDVSYDAILLDRMMPRMNGMELLAKIKQMDRFKMLPVILQTAMGSPEAVRAYLSAFDPRILGLTGSTADIRAAARAFGVFFEKRGGGEDYTVDHTAAFVLTDAQGRVSSVLPYDASVKDLASAVRKSLGPDPV